MKRRIGWFTVAVAGMALATHAQPYYETCSEASGSAGVGPGSYPFTTVGATNDGGAMPECAFDLAANPDVWLKYTAVSTGQALLTPADCDFAPFSVSVYSACGGTELGCTPDICFEESVGFSVVAGESYIIRIADYSISFSEPAYSTSSTLVISEPVPPDNDTCETAASIVGPGAYNIVFQHATTDATVLSCAGSQSGVRDVWYSYTAATTGNAIFEFRSGNANTTFGVFDECGGTLLACDASGYPNRTGLAVVAGEDYLLRVALKSTSTSDADRSLTVTEYAAPSNDTCGTAASIAVGVTNWDNTGAIESLAELNDSFPCVAGNEENASVWFKFVATSTGTAVVHVDATNTNNEDPVIAAYASCGGTALECNDNIGGFFNRDAGSYIAFPVVDGNTYFIRLAMLTQSNNTNYFSSGTLNVSIVTPLSNDECAGATTIAPGETVIDNRNAVTGSVQLTQCTGSTASTKDIWYKWTPSQSGLTVIHTCGSFSTSELFVNRNTILSVYENSCAELSELVCNSNDQESHDPPCGPAQSGFSNSYVEFNTIAGATYSIRVASEDALNFGLTRLNLEFTPISNVWVEMADGGGDAGLLINTAQTTAGVGTLGSILGRYASNTDVDLYTIEICDFNTFSATTGAPGGNTAFFLFDDTGRGVAFNDHTESFNLRASLSNQFVNSNGTYYLAVTPGSGFPGDFVHLVSLPRSAGGNIWEADPRSIERDPDGSGFTGVLTSWSTGTANLSVTDPKDYLVVLSGVCYAQAGCAADFNGTNGVTVQDIFDFLTAWLAGSPSADFNGVNSVTVQDIFDFLTAWLAGC